MQTVVTPEEQKKVLELEKMKRSLELQLQEMARKVEEQKQQIAMAMRDPLTGLRNREGVADQINTLLKKETKGTFFIMDMDNFKCVNDTYGHVEGDRVLVRFSSALRKVIGAEDIVARLGIKDFCGDKTLLIASHRANALKDMDEILFFENGKIVERGTHEELMKLNGRYAEIYNHQAGQEVLE